MPNLPPKNRIDVAWSDVVSFLRQLSHDIRNHLNAAELQAAYLGELAESAEMKEEVKRLREMIGEVSKALQAVTSRAAGISPTRIRYRCANLIEDVKQRLDSLGKRDATEWDVQAGDAEIEIDPQLLQEALLELFTNAFLYRSGEEVMLAIAKIENGKFSFTLREPKKEFDADTRNWGRQPLRKVGRGRYGLGLNRVRMIVEANDGSFNAKYDAKASALLSRIVIPLAKPPSA